MKILIVEDDALVALSLTFALEDAGHTAVGPTSSAARALELAAFHQPDLALVEISLENGQKGIWIAQELQCQFSISSVLTTSQPQLARDNACVARGMIVKPFHPASVVKALERLLRPPGGGMPPQEHEIELFDQPFVSGVDDR